MFFCFSCYDHASTVGGEANKTFGVDDIIDKYGVVKGSYDEVQLPKIRAFKVIYSKVGQPKDSFELKVGAAKGGSEHVETRG